MPVLTVLPFKVAGPDTAKAYPPLTAPPKVVMPVPLLSVVAAVNTSAVLASPNVNALFVPVAKMPAKLMLLGVVTLAPLVKLKLSLPEAPNVNAPLLRNGVVLSKVLLPPVTVKAYAPLMGLPKRKPAPASLLNKLSAVKVMALVTTPTVLLLAL